MGLVISSSFVLSQTGEVNANNPIVGWQDLVTSSNITATTQEDDHLAINLANPATNLIWRATDDSANTLVTVTISTPDEIDYVGIARHNFGSAQIPVSIEGTTDLDDWTELNGEVMPGTDSALIFRFEPQSLAAVRIRLQPGLEPPEAAVVHVGKLLVLPRRIYVGHTPLPYGRSSNIVTGRSESGAFLGRIVLSESLASSVEMQNVLPATFRSDIHPFFLAAVERPFFWAWRPGDYPSEAGFAWMSGDPSTSNQRPNGMVSISFSMQGIV